MWRELQLTRWRADLLGRTLGYNGAAAAIAAVMGLPAGLVLGRGRGLLSRFLWVLLPAALLMPSLSYAYGWAQLVRLLREWLYDGSGWVYQTAHDPAWLGPWPMLLFMVFAGLVRVPGRPPVAVVGEAAGAGRRAGRLRPAGRV